jgi:saccharopine dehydrogenase-like NADP-dependent oxidoreductase
MMSQAKADQLAKVYVKIRDRRRELEKQAAELKEQQDLIGLELLEICKEQGAQTIRTEFGTVSRRTTKNYWTSDWESFTNFIKEHNAFALLQQRINNTNMLQFLEENPDLLPPGLNADINQTVVITKR